MIYLLVDANNLAARHFYANKELMRADGFRTGLIYGVLKGLAYARHVADVPWNRVVMVWDGGRSEYRQEIYPEYKKGRKLSSPKTQQEEEETESYYYQMNLVRGMLPYLGLRQIHVKGVEADDVISVFTYLLEQDNHETIVYSGDKDMHQLARKSCRIFDPKKEILTEEQILEHWEVSSVDDILWLRTVQGDASDNIKGVAGIGVKRAKLALTQRDAGVNEDQRWWQKVCDNRDIVERNRRLMRLPATWEETYYRPEQCLEATEQFLQEPRRDLITFAQECKKYELQSILENLTSW